MFSPSGISGHKDTLVLVLNQIEQDIESLVNIQSCTCGKKKPTTKPTTKKQHKTKTTNKPPPQEQPGFNWFIPYVGFYKVAEVGFLFNYFPGETQ